MRSLIPTLILLCLGCSTGSRDRACDPTTRDACDPGLRCVIEVDGAPACVAPNGEDRGEGQLCEAADACGQGLACVSVLGVARCLRICPTGTVPDPCLGASAEPTADEASASFPAAPFDLRAAARCVSALPDRPDLGACVISCRPGVPGDCPEGTSCGPSVVLAATVCQATPEIGAGGVGAACGAGTAPCAQGLMCAALGVGRVCMRAAAGDCPAGTLRTELPLAATTADGDPPTVCTPCLPVGRYGPRLGTVLGVCLAATAPAATPTCDEGSSALGCACAPFGDPADLADAVAEPSALATAVEVAADLRGTQLADPWVAARAVDGVFVWASGLAVDAALWGPGEPGPEACAALGATGLFTRACDTLAPTLCRAEHD